MKINNNFGFLRLLFAVLVIFAHAPDALDGNKNRELMFSIFGSMTLGDLAVSGFFMISGYLILMSYQRSSSFKSYITKRILRIYPGFIVSTLFCYFCVVPLAQNWQFLAKFDAWFWLKSWLKMMILVPPWAGDVFTTPVPSLNEPAWTIRYEFLCYLILPLISYFFKDKIKNYLYLLTALLVAMFMLKNLNVNYTLPKPFDYEIDPFLRVFSAYLMGSIFYLLRDKIVFNAKYTIISTLILLILLFSKPFAYIALNTLGAYLLFHFALHYKNQFLSTIGSKTDFSYGIYLYAWPVQNLIIQKYPAIHPLILSLIVLAIAGVFALISWHWVEKPFLQLKNKLI